MADIAALLTMKEQYLLWFNFDLDANLKMLDVALDNAENIPADVLHLLSHNIAAHETWNSRVQSRKAVAGVWEGIPLAEMKTFLQTNYENSLHVLHDRSLDEVVGYANTKGELFQNSIADIYTHVLMHSMYHRGQIARSLRAAGIDPPDTNYITFRR